MTAPCVPRRLLRLILAGVLVLMPAAAAWAAGPSCRGTAPGAHYDGPWLDLKRPPPSELAAAGLAGPDLARAIQLVRDLCGFYGRLATFEPNLAARVTWETLAEYYDYTSRNLSILLNKNNIILVNLPKGQLSDRRGSALAVDPVLDGRWPPVVVRVVREHGFDDWPYLSLLSSVLVRQLALSDSYFASDWFEAQLRAGGIGPTLSQSLRARLAPSLVGYWYLKDKYRWAALHEATAGSTPARRAWHARKLQTAAEIDHALSGSVGRAAKPWPRILARDWRDFQRQVAVFTVGREWLYAALAPDRRRRSGTVRPNLLAMNPPVALPGGVPRDSPARAELFVNLAELIAGLPATAARQSPTDVARAEPPALPALSAELSVVVESARRALPPEPAKLPEPGPESADLAPAGEASPPSRPQESVVVVVRGGTVELVDLGPPEGLEATAPLATPHAPAEPLAVLDTELGATASDGVSDPVVPPASAARSEPAQVETAQVETAPTQPERRPAAALDPGSAPSLAEEAASLKAELLTGFEVDESTLPAKSAALARMPPVEPPRDVALRPGPASSLATGAAEVRPDLELADLGKVGDFEALTPYEPPPAEVALAAGPASGLVESQAEGRPDFELAEVSEVGDFEALIPYEPPPAEVSLALGPASGLAERQAEARPDFELAEVSEVGDFEALTPYEPPAAEVRVSEVGDFEALTPYEPPAAEVALAAGPASRLVESQAEGRPDFELAEVSEVGDFEALTPYEPPPAEVALALGPASGLAADQAEGRPDIELAEVSEVGDFEALTPYEPPPAEVALAPGPASGLAESQAEGRPDFELAEVSEVGDFEALTPYEPPPAEVALAGLPWLVDEVVPGLAAQRDDVFVGFERFDNQLSRMPDILHRVQLGRGGSPGR